METYTLQFQQAYKTVLTMILVPVISVLLFIYALTRFPDMPEWLVIGLIGFFLLAMVGLVLWLVLKKITVSCTVALNESGIAWTLDNPSPLYRRSYSVVWQDIGNIGCNVDANSLRSFVQVRIKNGGITASFNAKKDQEPVMDEFYASLIQYQEKYNEANAMMPITSKSFYDSWWATALTGFVYVFMVVIIGVSIFYPNNIEWYRIISFSCFSSLWLINYHYNRKKLKNLKHS